MCTDSAGCGFESHLPSAALDRRRYWLWGFLSCLALQDFRWGLESVTYKHYILWLLQRIILPRIWRVSISLGIPMLNQPKGMTLALLFLPLLNQLLWVLNSMRFAGSSANLPLKWGHRSTSGHRIWWERWHSEATSRCAMGHQHFGSLEVLPWKLCEFFG